MASILWLNSYHAGSHRAFVEQWEQHSSHDFTVLTLPGYKWKWRMRHAALTFSDELRARGDTGHDLLFCTDMLNLAEFRGLAPRGQANLPTIVYFHENQLTYPNRQTDPRDLHFAFTNLTTALAADRVWFNSEFHRSEFLTALQEWMRRMPDYEPQDVAARIDKRSAVHPPGIQLLSGRSPRKEGPLRIVWVGRWEHDKDPETFFQALEEFRQSGGNFRLSVVGESYKDSPRCFADARERFASQIDHWGYCPDRQEYLTVLRRSDVVVSTALHEFFGIGVLEAIAAGCFPLVPRRLAYPELFGDRAEFYHDGTAAGLTARLRDLSAGLDEVRSRDLRALADRFAWPRVAVQMDAAIDALLTDVS